MMNMNEALARLVDEIKADYLKFTSRDFTRELSDVNEKMINAFNEGLKIQEGRKYIKIMSERSVWGFIVKEDDKQFKAGDILKAASYNAPARNKARGNVFADAYTVRWTGPLYL